MRCHLAFRGSIIANEEAGVTGSAGHCGFTRGHCTLLAFLRTHVKEGEQFNAIIARSATE